MFEREAVLLLLLVTCPIRRQKFRMWVVNFLWATNPLPNLRVAKRCQTLKTCPWGLWEGEQSGLLPHKPILTTPDHLLVLQMFGNGAKNAGNHHFPRGQGGANQPVVSWILLLVILEDRSDIFFLLICRNLNPEHHGLTKTIKNGLAWHQPAPSAPHDKLSQISVWPLCLNIP